MEKYLALINPEKAMPEGFEETVERVWVENPEGARFQVEKKTYEAFLKLQKDLLENDGLEAHLLNSYRSIETQVEVFGRYERQFGLEYASRYAAKPGHSEHHTGLAIDVSFLEDGKLTHGVADLLKLEDKFRVVHGKLAKYGFLLRYPRGKEEITGIGYEPWHFRYIDDPEVAKRIWEKGWCFEEYWQNK